MKAYPGETTEAFCDGHVSGFSFFGGVPRSILYDNTKIAVARILGDGKRQRTRVFSELRSHYLFEDRFGRPGKGNDKGKVEGIVGYCRRNFLVPMPRFRNFDDLNRHLEACCAKRWAEQLRGHDQTVGERLERDRAVPATFPQSPTTPATSARGGSVRCRWCAIAAPITPSPHGSAIARCWSAAMSTRWSSVAPPIARHPRSYEQEDFVFAAALSVLAGAKDQRAGSGGSLGRLAVAAGVRRSPPPLEARMGKAGKREYVQVLRLIESFSLDDVRAAISEALERGVIGFDAKHLVLCRIVEAAATLEPAGPSLSAARRGGNNLGPLVHGAPEGGSAMSDTPQLLLAHHLKALKLPTFLREYDKQARQCAAEGVDHVRYLVRLTELELIEERRMVERRIRMAKFPAVKSLDSFDFKAMPSPTR